MSFNLLLKNGILVTPGESFKADIFVKDGKIADIGKFESGCRADEIYDAEGKHILPGIIDAHVHFRDPGLTQKEDFETGSMAAAFGGITMIADMPNTIPPTTTAERLKEKINIAKEKSYIDFAFFALLSSENTAEIENLKKAGALGLKIFLGTSTGDIQSPSPETIIEQLKICKDLNIRVGFHAETSDINRVSTAKCKEMTDNPCGRVLSDARPILSETMAIKDALEYAKITGAKIHIHHITCAEGISIFNDAKQNGTDVTAETCPHYLFLSADNDIQKVYPPIRSSENRTALWTAVKNGIINMIATDHAPHTAEEKAQCPWTAPAGLCGIETFVPLMLTEVNKGTITLNDFVRLASADPAKIWGVYPQKGNLLPGADADFTIVDMNKKGKIKKDELHSKNKTSPYHGMEIQGMPVATVVRGKFVMKDGELLVKKGYGVHIERQ